MPSIVPGNELAVDYSFLSSFSLFLFKFLTLALRNHDFKIKLCFAVFQCIFIAHIVVPVSILLCHVY